MKTPLGILLCLILLSCGQERKSFEGAEIYAEGSEKYVEGLSDESSYATDGLMEQNISGELFSSFAAAGHVADTSLKLIRSAELRFRVMDVGHSTLNIESLTMEMGGYVELTDLRSSVNRTTTNRLSNDSILETTYFTVSNRMVLKIPSSKLYAALSAISKEVDFLNYRNIRSRNVKLDILSNQLRETRARLAREQRISVTEPDRGETSTYTTTTSSPLQSQLMADEAKLALMDIEDKMKFSQVEIDLYERERTSRRVLPDQTRIKDYKPGFFNRLMDSLKGGWQVFVELILFLANLWVLFVLAILGFVFYKRFFSRKASK